MLAVNADESYPGALNTGYANADTDLCIGIMSLYSNVTICYQWYQGGTCV